LRLGSWGLLFSLTQYPIFWVDLCLAVGFVVLVWSMAKAFPFCSCLAILFGLFVVVGLVCFPLLLGLLVLLLAYVLGLGTWLCWFASC